MAARSSAIDAAIGRPLRLPYHPLYRFHEGGSLTRTFRGLPDRPDDWWSEDWVGSCTVANNPGPDGASQGLSTVEVPGAGEVTLKELVETAPEAMVGAAFADRYGPITGVLVKLLSPAGQVPLHAHPSRAWAREHLGTPFGKTEAWILLDTPGDGPEPAMPGLASRRASPASGSPMPSGGTIGRRSERHSTGRTSTRARPTSHTPACPITLDRETPSSRFRSRPTTSSSRRPTGPTMKARRWAWDGTSPWT